MTNPKWLSAKFELTVVYPDGRLVPDSYRMRFDDDTIDKACELVKARDWAGLSKISIPIEV